MAVYHSGVYEIRNVTNGHRYIGGSVSIPGRFCGHRCGLRRSEHPNRHLQSAYHKYGEENFVYSPLLYCDPENVLLYEQVCIDGLHPEYNIAKDATAPMRGLRFSEEHKRKIMESQKGISRRPHTEEEKKRQSEREKGKSHNRPFLSNEHKQKISNAMSGNNNALGYRQTEETRKNMSKAQKKRQAAVRGEL